MQSAPGPGSVWYIKIVWLCTLNCDKEQANHEDVYEEVTIFESMIKILKYFRSLEISNKTILLQYKFLIFYYT